MTPATVWQFEVATDAMSVADDEARYVVANPQAEALIGYSREELLRLRVTDLTPRTVPQQFPRTNLSGSVCFLCQGRSTRKPRLMTRTPPRTYQSIRLKTQLAQAVSTFCNTRLL